MIAKPRSAEEKLQAICLKTQISLVRNVAGYTFPTDTPRGAPAPVEQWLQQIAALAPYEDLTDDPVFAKLAEHRYGLAAPEDRLPDYRLLRFRVTDAGETHTFWCELMAGNHFTFSSSGPDLDFETRLAALERFSERFAKVFHFAYDEQFGYLTSMPTLTGTGLRIRSWVHLGGMRFFGYLHQMARAAEVKGVLAEFSADEAPAAGSIVILYNRFSLNLPAIEIARDFKRFLLRLAQQEIRARMRIAHDEPVRLYDKLNRLHLTCKNALLVPEHEAMNLLSAYWIGCTCGAITPIDDPDYAFVNCFDIVRDALCPNSLLNKDKPYDLSGLPPICRQEYLLNYKMLRALWLRKLADAAFTPAFLKRMNRL